MPRSRHIHQNTMNLLKLVKYELLVISYHLTVTTSVEARQWLRLLFQTKPETREEHGIIGAGKKKQNQPIIRVCLIHLKK